MKHSNYESTDKYQEQALPIDTNDHHIFLEPVQSLRDNNELVNSYLHCIDDGKKGRQPSQEKSLRKHLELFLCNLAIANEQNKWLCIELTKCKFAKHTWYSNIGLKRTHIKVVIEGMLRHHFITRKGPVNFPGHNKVTRFFPTQKLIDSLKHVVDNLKYPFIEPYVRVNGIETEYEEVFEQIQQPDSNHPDIVNLRKINNFIKEHNWPRKGPIKLIYKGNPFNGGRVYTPFQNIKNKEEEDKQNSLIRLNSLIDGQPIVEVDFSANHLRLSLAIFSKIDIGPEDPYMKIASFVGEDRESVKQLITQINNTLVFIGHHFDSKG